MLSKNTQQMLIHGLTYSQELKLWIREQDCRIACLFFDYEWVELGREYRDNYGNMFSKVCNKKNNPLNRISIIGPCTRVGHYSPFIPSVYGVDYAV